MDWDEFKKRVRCQLSRAENAFVDDYYLHDCFAVDWSVEDTVLDVKESFKCSGHGENDPCRYCGQYCEQNCDEAQMEDD